MSDFLYPNVKDFSCSCCKYVYSLDDLRESFCVDCWAYCYSYEYKFCVVGQSRRINSKSNEWMLSCEPIKEPVVNEKPKSNNKFRQERLMQ